MTSLPKANPYTKLIAAISIRTGLSFWELIELPEDVFNAYIEVLEDEREEQKKAASKNR